MSEQARHFTQSAERVLALAQEEAERRGGKAIDSEHLLLGLLREGGAITRDFMQALSLDPLTVFLMQDITTAMSLRRGWDHWLRVVTRDLRGPIGAIKGYGEILQRASLPDEKRQHCVEGIITSTDHVVAMINAIDDSLRHIDASAFVREPFDLKGLLDEVIADLGGAASDKSVRISFDFPADGCEVLGVKDRLYLVARKLLSNAIKHSPDDEDVNIILSQDATDIQFRIRGRGPGIPEEDMPHIFERYFGNPRIMSLTLQHIKYLVQEEGGTIEARNMLEGGVEFVVRLPAWMEVDMEG